MNPDTFLYIPFSSNIFNIVDYIVNHFTSDNIDVNVATLLNCVSGRFGHLKLQSQYHRVLSFE